MTVTHAKPESTEELRRAVLTSTDVVETDRADSGLTTVSFQSVKLPSRHVWVDTDLAGVMVADLEEWANASTWDNSIAHLTAPTISILSAIVLAWLHGSTVTQCKSLGGTDVDLH